MAKTFQTKEKKMFSTNSEMERSENDSEANEECSENVVTRFTLQKGVSSYVFSVPMYFNRNKTTKVFYVIKCITNLFFIFFKKLHKIQFFSIVVSNLTLNERSTNDI